MTEYKNCSAVRHGDRTECSLCNLQWDTNDSNPPKCQPRLHQEIGLMSKAEMVFGPALGGVLAQGENRIAELRASYEMKLVAISVAAYANTRESAARACHPDYTSVALVDVQRAVGREMDLREKLDAIRARLDKGELLTLEHDLREILK